MKKTILLLIPMMALLFSCSKSGDAQPVNPPQAPQGTDGSDGGPYTVAFNPSTSVYEHSFKIPINQASGKVEYFLLTDRVENVTLELATSSVVGCDVAKVKHQVFWLPDASSTSGQMLTVNSKFTTRRQVRGVIRHEFTGIDGCTTIQLSMRLRQAPHAGNAQKPCEGSASIQDCRVDVYCRESYSTQFVEVEIWNRSGAITLQKYMNSGAGTRSLMSMTSVAVTNTPALTTYTSTSPSYPAYLRFNPATLSGVFTETVNGHDFSNTLQCDL